MKTGVIFCWPRFNSTLFLSRWWVCLQPKRWKTMSQSGNLLTQKFQGKNDRLFHSSPPSTYPNVAIGSCQLTKSKLKFKKKRNSTEVQSSVCRDTSLFVFFSDPSHLKNIPKSTWSSSAKYIGVQIQTNIWNHHKLESSIFPRHPSTCWEGLWTQKNIPKAPFTSGGMTGCLGFVWDLHPTRPSKNKQNSLQTRLVQAKPYCWAGSARAWETRMRLT